MRSRAAFLARFFALAALLFALWSFAGAGDLYTRLAVWIANPLMEPLTGFRVTRMQPMPHGLDLVITRGSDVTVMPLKPREIFSGLVPFLALIGASSGLGALHRLKAIGIGTGVLLVFHIGLLLLGPYFTGGPQANWSVEWARRINRLIDVFYGFYGLIGYAALPFLLWFWLGRTEPLTDGDS